MTWDIYVSIMSLTFVTRRKNNINNKAKKMVLKSYLTLNTTSAQTRKRNHQSTDRLTLKKNYTWPRTGNKYFIDKGNY